MDSIVQIWTPGKEISKSDCVLRDLFKGFLTLIRRGVHLLWLLTTSLVRFWTAVSIHGRIGSGWNQ